MGYLVTSGRTTQALRGRPRRRVLRSGEARRRGGTPRCGGSPACGPGRRSRGRGSLGVCVCVAAPRRLEHLRGRGMDPCPGGLQRRGPRCHPGAASVETAWTRTAMTAWMGMVRYWRRQGAHCDDASPAIFPAPWRWRRPRSGLRWDGRRRRCPMALRTRTRIRHDPRTPPHISDDTDRRRRRRGASGRCGALLG